MFLSDAMLSFWIPSCHKQWENAALGPVDMHYLHCPVQSAVTHPHKGPPPIREGIFYGEGMLKGLMEEHNLTKDTQG